jgi:hypothetical protein
MELQVYRIVADLQSQPGYIVWVVRGKEVFPHDEFAPIIGDVIHNLRDALDLAVAVIMRNAGEPDEHVYFPTADAPYAFKKTIAKGSKKPHFPQDLIDVLETTIQPYKGGDGHYLRTLHRLAIMDKHRIIVPTVFGTSAVVVSTEGMTLPFYTGMTPLAIKDGGIFARLLVSEFPNIKVNQEADITLTIAFNDSGPLGFLDIETALRFFFQATEDAMNAMRSCL